MGSALYPWLVFVHVLAALFWLGGMFFFAAVGAPVLRKVDSPELRRALFRDLGLAFRKGGWIAIAVLVASGIGILEIRGLLRTGVLLDPQWWSTPFGRALFWKLTLVVFMIAASAVHDFALGPAASATGGASPAMRRRAALLARGNALAGLVLLYWATRLARGG